MSVEPGGEGFAAVSPTVDSTATTAGSNEVDLIPVVEEYNPKPIDSIPVEPPPDITLELKPCPICTRTFVPSTLVKHVNICEKMALKKRKQFDSSRQRREGTDLADFLPKNFGLPQPKQEPKLSPKAVQSPQVTQPVKKVEEPIVKSIAPAVRKKSVSPVAHHPSPIIAKEKVRPTPKRSMSLPSEQCPYCERNFGLKAYDRHVEWCKEKTRFNQQQNSTTLTAAKERLQARTKYRAPCLKTKRAANREKYSGLSCGESTNSLSDGGGGSNSGHLLSPVGKSKSNLEDGKMCMSMSMSMSTSMTSSVMSDSVFEDNLYDTEALEFPTPRNPSMENEAIELKTSDSSITRQSRQSLSVFDNDSIKSQDDERPCLPPLRSVKHVVNCVSKHQDVHKFIQSSNSKTHSRNNILPLQKPARDAKNSRKKLPQLVRPNQISSKNLASSSSSTINPKTSKTSGKKPVSLAVLNDMDVNGENIELSVVPFTLYPSESSANSVIACSELKWPDKLDMDSENEKIHNNFQNSPANCIKTRLSQTFKTTKDDIVIKKTFVARGKRNTDGLITILSPRLQAQKSFSDFPAGLSPVQANNESMATFSEDEESLQSLHSSSKSYTIGGLSDKYDPFLSAKRQLEELCSPSSMFPPDIVHSTPVNQTKQTSTKSSSCSTANPKATLNTVKSNFRRTSSLRVPRKVTPTRTLFIPPLKQPKPTIQRGISDEGPISHSFLKPEEYDEMPVKSVCVNDFAARHHHHDISHHSPKVIKRDSATNRRHLKLNFNHKNTDRSSLNTDNPLSKTDSLAVFLKYENETKNLDLTSNLTEKDIKDKSNSLSKQTSLKNSATDVNSLLGEKDKLASLKNSVANMIDSSKAMSESPSSSANTVESTQYPGKIYPIKLEPLPKINLISTNKSATSSSIRNNSGSKIGSLNLSSILDPKDSSDYIDPKLINICDNLPINITKLSDSDLTSSSTESGATTKYLNGSQSHLESQTQQRSLLQQPSSNRNSTEKRNLLKRQIRLGKNQILYDMSPDNDPYSEECDKTISIIDTDSNKVDPCSNEPLFDDFDFEEFITRFEDDEQFPIFKDYKEFLSNRSNNKRSSNNCNQNLSRSPTILTTSFDGEIEKGQINTDSEKNLKNVIHLNPLNKSHPVDIKDALVQSNDDVDTVASDNQNQNQISSNVSSDHSSGDDKPREVLSLDGLTDVNQNCMKSTSSPSPPDEVFVTMDQNDRICESATSMYPVDSDEISSVECFPLRRSLQSKQSADSAYGSLSRQSPIDRSLRRNPVRSRQQIINIPDLCLSKPKHHTQKIEIKGRNRDLSASSSGSDTSLPPIQSLIDKEKYLQTSDKKDSKLSKFCHECGSKFLIPQAKFCMECGVRRMVID